MGVEHTLKQNIWVACSDNDLERIKELLTGSDLEPKVDVNCKDEYGYTPLHAAASYGHEEVVKYLIQMGANVNIRDEDGDTPLHVTESLSTLMILLNHGADPLVRNYVGKTPYHVYLEEELDDVSAYLATYLIDRGIQIDDHDGVRFDDNEGENDDESDEERNDDENGEDNEEDAEEQYLRVLESRLVPMSSSDSDSDSESSEDDVEEGDLLDALNTVPRMPQLLSDSDSSSSDISHSEHEECQPQTAQPHVQTYIHHAGSSNNNLNVTSNSNSAHSSPSSSSAASFLRSSSSRSSVSSSSSNSSLHQYPSSCSSSSLNLLGSILTTPSEPANSYLSQINQLMSSVRSSDQRSNLQGNDGGKGKEKTRHHGIDEDDAMEMSMEDEEKLRELVTGLVMENIRNNGLGVLTGEDDGHGSGTNGGDGSSRLV